MTFLCFPEICKLFSKKFSIDVAEGGKIKKHSRSEFNFEAVTHKFQVLLLFYIYLFTFVHYSGPGEGEGANHLPTCRACMFA